MVEPLRIQKDTPTTSPLKNNTTRPLSELSPLAARRNSPSSQSIKTQLLDSSTFETSPFSSKFASFAHKESPHLYWQNRDSPSPTRGLENYEPSDELLIGSKRPSVENLKRASRVTKSNIFALEQKQEYDPMTSPRIERPLASGRSLAVGMSLGLQARNSILEHSKPFEKKRTRPEEIAHSQAPHTDQLQTDVLSWHVDSPSSTAQPSPTKSSMSQNPRFSMYDPETSIWSEPDENEDCKLPPGKGLHRHAKSVTFNKSPPEVNEYEQVTPDPSISADSRESSYDHVSDEEEYETEITARAQSDDSFDESLEDTDKTPVVLPEEWRQKSSHRSEAYHTDDVDDTFVHADAIHESPFASNVLAARPSPTRTDSLSSNGSKRPLPPLPPAMFPREQADSHESLEAVAERAAIADGCQQFAPQAAGISKDEIKTIGSSAMSLEERFSLMSTQDSGHDKRAQKPSDDARERRMRRKSGFQNSVSGRDIKIFEDSPLDEEKADDVGETVSSTTIPRISRESILRKVQTQRFDEYQSPEPANTPMKSLPELNPDEPIQSYEESPFFLEQDDDVDVKIEDEESLVDICTIPIHSESNNGFPPQSKSQPANVGENDTESQYSTDAVDDCNEAAQAPMAQSHPAMGKGPLQEEGLSSLTQRPCQTSLSDFGTMIDTDFGLSLSSYMTPSPQNSISNSTANAGAAAELSFLSTKEDGSDDTIGRIPGYSDDELREPSTPDSVIRRSLSQQSSEGVGVDVPDPVATIKAPGSKMKTRVSLTPQDTQAMAETRRQVSGNHDSFPIIPERHISRPSMIMEDVSSPLKEDGISQSDPISNASDRLRLDLSVSETEVGDLSFGLDKEFDRVIEAQKVTLDHLLQCNDLFNSHVIPTSRNVAGNSELRKPNANNPAIKQKGYLMRQNTKMVVASSGLNTTTTSDDGTILDNTTNGALPTRETRSANSSPLKKQQHGASSAWQTHEWIGKTRRKSIRQSAGMASEIGLSGGVPPLPGQTSAVSPIDVLSELDELEVGTQEGVERGRLFVRVVGVKDLNLPLSRNERSDFALTLDNGLHCVTTSWLELNKSAPIGQEFELVVLDELEFQLTLQIKLEQPKPAQRPESPSKQTSPTKRPGFGRFFGSPKKKRENELKQEQERLEKERQQNQARLNPSAWDLLHNLVAKDGSFARAYISLKEYESHAYGRPFTVDIPCFNEWAMDEPRTIGSTRSGRFAVDSNTMQRRPPYKVGKLELQLLYVPKPRDVKDEDMPKSMNACVREMQEAEKSRNLMHEGYLSQQGGDCPYWRRRFFRLAGSKLTAYHETTHQPRATINLAKAVKLIDDKTNLKQQTNAKSGGRRKSAFGSEEEGYMFLEEGFRVRFANGETIDFYADNVSLKDAWMVALANAVGNDKKSSRSWTELVLRREKTTSTSGSHTQDTHRRKPCNDLKGQSGTFLATADGILPGPRVSSRGDNGRRPNSSGDKTTSRPAQLKQGDIMGPPAPPAKDRKVADAADRRAKARSTYY